jgi:hypothetical protein
VTTVLCYRDRMSSSRSLLLLSACALSTGCNEFNISVPSFTELFQQSPWEKVDVLLVVDNSGSMAPYQDKLATDFDVFFEFFAEGEVDWNLGVVHTDGTDPTLGRIRGPVVTSETPNPEELFAEIVHVGAQGGGLEVGLESAKRALSQVQQGFPREDASTSVIFVSDEQDSSPESVDTYINAFYELHGPRLRHAFNASALTVSELADCTPEQFLASAPGTRYVEVARVTGGITGNLCVDDFEQIVLDLALTTSATLDTFFMRSRPSLSTLVVSIDDEEIGCEEGIWSYTLIDREGVPTPAITFPPEHIPFASAEILVEYQRGTGDPATFCGGVDP